MDAIVDGVLESIESRVIDPGSLEGLSRVEADLLAGVTAKGVIGNGGLVYWYEGMNARQTLRAAEAFERLGLSEAASALRKSLEAFPAGAPPAELGDRQRYVSQHRERLDQSFASLDEMVWNADFDGAALRYVRAHRSELVAADPNLRSLLMDLSD